MYLQEKFNWLLKQLRLKDEYGFFLEPVDPLQVPEYRDVIKRPMDFGTMAKKVTAKQYPTFQAFQDDVDLICSNCKLFNPPDTLYWRSADRIEKMAPKLIAKENEKFQGMTRCKTQKCSLTQLRS